MHSPKIPSGFDRALLLLCILGLCTLAFVSGALVLRYKLPTSQFLTDAFDAMEAWHEAFKEADEREKEKHPPLLVNDEQRIEGTVVSGNKQLAYNGYTLVSIRFSTSVFLLDMDGRVVYRWDMPFLKAWPNPKHIHKLSRARIYIDKAYVFPNGDLLAQYSGFGDTPHGYGIAKMDKNSNVLWTYDANSHHDFILDNDGYIYALIHELITKPTPGADFLPPRILSDYIVKLNSDGKEIERISVLDAFLNTPFVSKLYKPKGNMSRVWDYFHTNAVAKLEPSMANKFPMFKAGYILISMRALDALAVIDPKTKKVMWMHQGSWKWPHAASYLPNGNILFLDNLGRITPAGNFARVIEFDPKTEKIIWKFSGTPNFNLNTSIFGRLQRLPNGNTLIGETMNARILEVTPNGTIAWSYSFTQKVDNAIATATRYTKQDLPFLITSPTH